MEISSSNNSPVEKGWDVTDWYIALGFILLALLLRLYFYTGLFGSDEFVYTNMALNILQGNWSVSEYVGATRYGVNIPVAIFMKLFGISEFSANFWSLLTSVMEVGLVYAFSRQLLGLRAAIFATLVITFLPLHIHYAGRMMADAPLAFFITLSFFLFWLAEKRNSTLLFIFSGFSIGSVFWIKESVLAYSAVFALYPIVLKKWNPKWLIMIMAAAVMVFLNCLLLYVLSGDFLHIFHVIQGATERVHGDTSKRREVFYYLNYLLFDIKHTWLLGYCALAGTLFYFLGSRKNPKDNDLRLILIWGGGLFALLSFLVMPTGEVISKQTNYILVFTAPLCMLAGYGINRLKHGISMTVCMILIAGSLILASLEQQVIRVFTANSFGIVEFVKANPDNPVYASSRAHIIATTFYKLQKDIPRAQTLDLDDLVLNDQIELKNSSSTNDEKTYAIFDRETINSRNENEYLVDTSDCLHYIGNITPTGFGIGKKVVDSIRYVAELITPDIITKKILRVTDPYFMPKPAEIYQVNNNCQLGKNSP